MSNARAWTMALLAVLALAGCGRSGSERQVQGSTSGKPPAGVSPPSANEWTVDPTGLGPVRAGMTVAEAESALRVKLRLNPVETPCTYAYDMTRPGVAFMIMDGQIARVDVRDSTVTTTEGARIGDSEERIQALYPGRVEVHPHKYTDGRYLIVRPEAPADTTHRLIFETDGRRVTTFRGGRLPEVAWVEGCS